VKRNRFYPLCNSKERRIFFNRKANRQVAEDSSLRSE
jgi:hypothetical protein